MMSLERYFDYVRPRLSHNVYLNNMASLKRMPLDGSANDFDVYFSERLKKVSGKTLNNELSVLKAYIRWAQSRGYRVEKSILDYKRFRHVPRKFRRALSCDEIARLKAISGKQWLWWSFMMHTGLRKSEFRTLRACDVDLGTEPYVRIVDAKDPTRHRIVPLRSEITNILRKRQFKSPYECLFKVPQNLWRCFKNDLRQAGISSEIDLHCLRVTFVSALARAGVSPRTAQELAGHKDIRTTLKIYTKVTDKDKVDAVNRLKF